MRRIPLVVAAGLCLLLSPDLATAADAADASESSPTQPEPRDEVSLAAEDASVFVPAGWIQVPPQAGATVVLRAAGDVDAQIEVRTSGSVGPPRQPNYFSTFHAHIKQAGFEQTSRKEGTCGPHAGTEVTYRGLIEGRSFQLVICQWTVSQRVWLVSAFYPRAAKQFYYPGFQSVLAESRFD